ncbi:MAG: hypothetical protein L0387_37000 [Acidobacteria bacterium]|nr:hypothetical protein [Acidobacteriota bacterium]
MRLWGGRSRRGPVRVALLVGLIGLAGATTVMDPKPAITGHESTEMVSTPEGLHTVNNGYPGQTLDARGRHWLVWTSTRLKDWTRIGHTEDYVRGDKILARYREGDRWSEPIVLSTEHGINWEPAVVATPDGRAWVFWSTRRNKNYDILARSIDMDLKLSPEFWLTQDPAVDASPRAILDGEGNIWVVWESLRDNQYQIYARVYRQGRWSEPHQVSDNSGHNYRPVLAVAPDGRLWVAWDSAITGRYAIFLRHYQNGTWSPVQQVPADPGLDVYAPSIAADKWGTLWIACAQNPAPQPLWGLRGVRDEPDPRPRVLLVAYKNDRWFYPAPLGEAPPGLLTSDGDMPVIYADSSGRVWVFFQRMRSHLNFRIMATYYQDARWADLVELGAREPLPEASWVIVGGRSLNGRIDNRPVPVQLPDGSLRLAYERDRGWFTNRDIFVRTLKAAERTNVEPVLSSGSLPPSVKFAERVYPGSPAVRRSLSVEDRAYNVYYGDLHGHLLMDDGHTGTPDQYFAFARDRRGLDFVAYTPHTESHKFLISEISLVQRMAAAFNEPGRFVTFSGFEWSQGDYKLPREGHKHLIFESDDHPIVISTDGDADTVTELNQFLRTTDGIMFAHHLPRAISGGTRWDVIDARVEPDAEIVSHWGRGEYYGNPGHTTLEVHGASLQDGWATGLQLGVVGGSDNHDLFTERETALTVVFAPTLNRREIMEALKQRRCYATTGEPIFLDFRINGSLMGEQIFVLGTPSLRVHVIGTGALQRVDIVKHVKGGPYPFPVVHSVAPEGRECQFTWKDAAFAADAMYYVRVTQEKSVVISEVKKFPSAGGKLAVSFPNEMAWSSPIWVKKH